MNILFSIFGILLFAACNIRSDEQRYRGYKIAIDISHIQSVHGSTNAKILNVKIPVSNSTTFDYNKSLKDIYFVKLETTTQSKFGSMDKIFITDSRIIIVDLNVSKGVFIFDTAGRFINAILVNKSFEDRRESLTNFNDVAYDYTANEIILHDISNNKLFYFDKDGNFKNVSKEYVYFLQFVNLKNTDKFAYYNPLGGNDHIPALNQSAIYIGKRNTQILYTATNVIKNFKSGRNYYINNNASFKNNNNTVFYTPDFSDTVYQIEGSPVNVYPKLVIHYPGPDINTKIRESNKEGIEEYIKLKNKNQYYSFEGEIFCNDDSIYFIATYKNILSGYFYSAKTNKIIGGDLVSMVATKDSAQIEAYTYPVTAFNDYFVSVLPFSNFVDNKTLRNAKLTKIKKSIKPIDNPILAFYRLKDF